MNDIVKSSESEIIHELSAFWPERIEEMTSQQLSVYVSKLGRYTPESIRSGLDELYALSKNIMPSAASCIQAAESARLSEVAKTERKTETPEERQRRFHQEHWSGIQRVVERVPKEEQAEHLRNTRYYGNAMTNTMNKATVPVKYPSMAAAVIYRRIQAGILSHEKAYEGPSEHGYITRRET